jgi:hypothetical protein
MEKTQFYGNSLLFQIDEYSLQFNIDLELLYLKKMCSHCIDNCLGTILIVIGKFAVEIHSTECSGSNASKQSREQRTVVQPTRAESAATVLYEFSSLLVFSSSQIFQPFAKVFWRSYTLSLSLFVVSSSLFSSHLFSSSCVSLTSCFSLASCS